MRHIAWIAVLLAGCGSKPPQAPAPEQPKPVKITHFYGNQAVLPRGETLTLCYGTDGATSVSMSNYAEELRPSLNYCVADKPSKATTYTLIAKGPGGQATESFSVQIGPPGPPRESGESREMIKSFNVLGRGTASPGSPAQLCYTTEGAVSVSMRPPVKMQLAPGKNVCFVERPTKTTTYILTAVAADGAVDRMQVTVAVQ